MNFLDLNIDCLSLILEKLDFDSISELRKTCKLFHSAPLTNLEKKILNCGDFIYPRKKEKIRCNHIECLDLIAQRIESGKIKKVQFIHKFDDLSFEYRYKFFQMNPNSLNIGAIRDLFEYGIIFGEVNIVMDTYKVVFQQLDEVYNQQLDNPDHPNNDFELLEIKLRGMYYKRALANFGYNFGIFELMEILYFRDYPEWNEDEIYIRFDEMDLDEINDIFQGYSLTHNI